MCMCEWPGVGVYASVCQFATTVAANHCHLAMSLFFHIYIYPAQSLFPKDTILCLRVYSGLLRFHVMSSFYRAS